MANEPVLGWDQRVLLVKEATFGTVPDPAGAQALEVVSLDMGPVEQGFTRAKKDKTQGRGMTSAFVEGRKQPIPFSLETSVKSRAAADTVPKESDIYEAAGFTETVNSSTSVVYTTTATPTPNTLAIRSVLGTGTAANEAEQGRGGVVKQLAFSGGDTELMLKVSGAFAGKYWLGQSTGTVANGSDLTIALGTAAHAYRFGVGYYQIESEIVYVSAVNYSTGDLTVTRAQLSSSGAAHSAAAIYPYIPSLTLAGSPISEANVTVTLDGTATRCTKFDLTIDTGIDHLPAESGSSYVQGAKATRMNAKLNVEMVLTREQVAWIGKANQRKAIAVTIACGTGAGGIVTFSLPYCEVEPFNVPAPANDITLVRIPFRCRDSSGNDMFSFTLT